MNIAFHPAFDDEAVFADRFWRAAHYLGAAIDRIDAVVFRAGSALPSAPPNYLDQTLPARAGAFLTRAELRDADAPLETCDVAIVWDAAHANDAELSAAAQVAVLDPAMLHEGDLWIELSASLSPVSGEARAAAQSRLLAHCAAARRDTVHVFGTGPSLAEVDLAALAPGASIVCNSLVRNHEFLRALRPAIITAVDPVFHAGASRHAGAFRRELFAALRACDALFVAQERDVKLFAAGAPAELRERIVGVPVRFAQGPNFDLARRFHVTATRNVLTLTLLPLAAQLGRDVRIYGCDGKPEAKSEGFWAYDARSEFKPELEQQREAHPGFYSLDYREYYAMHCETVRRWIAVMETRGFRVLAGTPSYIPALARRAAPGVARRPPGSLAFAVESRIAYAKRQAQSAYGALINGERAPGWMKSAIKRIVRGLKGATSRRQVAAAAKRAPRFLVWFWSHGGGGSVFAVNLARRLAQRFGVERVALSMLADDPTAADAEAAGVRVLRADIVSSRRRLVASALSLLASKRTIERHIREADADVVLVAMNFAVAAPLALVAPKPIVYFMHDPAPHEGDYARAAQRMTQAVLSRRARALAALSAFGAEAIAAQTGRAARVTPLNAVLPPVAHAPGEAPVGPVRLLMIGRLIDYKGLDLLAAALERIASRDDWRLTVSGHGPAAAQASALQRFPQVERTDCKWLSDEELEQLIANHDIVLAPYISATQSGVVAQALAHAKPCIATPVGALAEQIGDAGWIADEASADAFARALEQALDNRNEIARRSANALRVAQEAWRNQDWTWLEEVANA